MLKTISAALLAVSVLTAPALAAGTDKTVQAPVTKSVQTKASVVNANAKVGRHHVRHASHHRFHKKMATHKMHRSSNVAAKHVTHPAKRG
jgi:Ni/Co efflux regulator RcnB